MRFAESARKGGKGGLMARRHAGVQYILAAALVVLPGAIAGQQQSGVPSAAQATPGVPSGRHGGLGTESGDGPGPFGGGNAAKIEHMREDERRKRLEADTARLLALTNELKEEIEKSSKDELSLDVVRKAAEIEKLARDVKERMKS